MNNEEESILKLYYPFYEKENALMVISEILLAIAIIISFIKTGILIFIKSKSLNFFSINIYNILDLLLTILIPTLFLGSLYYQIKGIELKNIADIGRISLYSYSFIDIEELKSNKLKLENYLAKYKIIPKEDVPKDYFLKDSENKLENLIFHLDESIFHQYFKIRNSKFIFQIMSGLISLVFVITLISLQIENRAIHLFLFEILVLILLSPYLQKIYFLIFKWEDLTGELYGLRDKLHRVNNIGDFFYIFYYYNRIIDQFPVLPSKIFYKNKNEVENKYKMQIEQLVEEIENISSNPEIH